MSSPSRSPPLSPTPAARARSLSLMRAVLLVLVMLVAAVCGNFQHSPVAGPADVVAEACGVCADVWMKVRPRTGPNPILPALETGDNVSSECLQLVMENPLPVRHTWRDFVGMVDQEIPWCRVGELPNADENVVLMQQGCECSFVRKSDTKKFQKVPTAV